jgi:phosphoglycolate phosphatase
LRPVLLFDLDGTLTNPREGIIGSFRYALESVGADVPSLDELERFIGPPLRDTFASLLDEHDERVDLALRFFRERYGTIGLYENDLYPGIVETITGLQPLARSMFIATSKPQDYAVRIIDHFGLQPFFRNVYGCEMDGRRSDKGELIAHILQQEAIEPAGVVMIGDRKHDVIGARRNGIRSIGVGWGFGSTQELRDAEADVICDSVEDLLRHFRGLGSSS